MRVEGHDPVSYESIYLHIDGDNRMGGTLHTNLVSELNTDAGTSTFTSPPQKEECFSLPGKWTNIENRIGLVGLYGADNLSIHRHPQRRAGALQSLFVEEVCYPGVIETTKFEANEIILDAGWAVISSAETDATKSFYTAQQKVLVGAGYDNVRAVRVEALDKKMYYVIANFGNAKVSIAISAFADDAHLTDLASGKLYSSSSENTIQLSPCQATVLGSK